MQETNETNQTEKEEVTAHSTEATTAVSKKAARSIKKYVVVALIVVVMGVVLLYMLEKQGRVSTGVFGDLVGGQPVAYVNGESIIRRDYESSANQLLQMAAAQGANVADEETVASLRAQALDTLINGELLRQEAVESGMKAAEDAVDARYAEIAAGVGGEEELAVRMAEFGITEEVLRRDIENEILIQGLFDERFPSDSVEITEEEIKAFYDQVTAGAEEAPALADVSAQIEDQLKRERQQQEVSELINALRAEAEIETLL